MDIAALSMGISNANLMNEMGAALLSKSLDDMEVLSDGIVKMMESSVTPYLGQNFDVSL